MNDLGFSGISFSGLAKNKHSQLLILSVNGISVEYFQWIYYSTTYSMLILEYNMHCDFICIGHPYYSLCVAVLRQSPVCLSIILHVMKHGISWYLLHLSKKTEVLQLWTIDFQRRTTWRHTYTYGGVTKWVSLRGAWEMEVRECVCDISVRVYVCVFLCPASCFS